MADDRTNRLGLPWLMAGQAQKELTHNEALALLDIATCPAAESADVAVPPSGATPGQCWIVAAGASGAWAGRTDEIAGWTASGWLFVAPITGMEVWVADRGGAVRWSGSAWHDGALRADGLYHGNVQVVGARGAAIAGPTGGSVIDAESRAAIDAILAMLQLHGMIAAA
ncbi:MAG: DUF2793 domain-containing protein [Sphingobium sp.]